MVVSECGPMLYLLSSLFGCSLARSMNICLNQIVEKIPRRMAIDDLIVQPLQILELQEPIRLHKQETKTGMSQPYLTASLILISKNLCHFL